MVLLLLDVYCICMPLFFLISVFKLIIYHYLYIVFLISCTTVEDKVIWQTFFCLQGIKIILNVLHDYKVGFLAQKVAEW